MCGLYLRVQVALRQHNVAVKFFAAGGMAADAAHHFFVYAQHKQGGDGGAAHGMAGKVLVKFPAATRFGFYFHEAALLAAVFGQWVVPAGEQANGFDLDVEVGDGQARQKEAALLFAVTLENGKTVIGQRYANGGIGFLRVQLQVAALSRFYQMATVQPHEIANAQARGAAKHKNVSAALQVGWKLPVKIVVADEKLQLLRQ